MTCIMLSHKCRNSEYSRALGASLPDEDTRGALVMEITKDSPAARAGLRSSDQPAELDGIEVWVKAGVLVSIQGLSLENMDDLVAFLVDQTAISDRSRIEVLRAG